MTKEDIIVKLMNPQYKPKGDIEGYPLEIVAEMIYYQVEQGNPFGVAVFENKRSAQKDDLGFDWDKTPDGKDFWQRVLEFPRINKSIRHFYRNLMVTKDSTGRTMSIYEYMLKRYKGIDFEGDIAGFPHRVVAMMMTEQFNQGNPPNLEVFEKNVKTPRSVGGFSWDITPEGDDFWIEVISYKNWEVFDKKYPQTKNPKSNIAMTRDDILIELHSNKYKPKGDLEGLPMEIIASMLYNQALQGNDVDTNVLEQELAHTAKNGGFDWERTTEGKEFWEKVLDPFKVDEGIRALYDKYDRSLSVYQYFVDKIKRNDIEFTGEIESFPTPVVAMMMAEQWNQGKPTNIEVFFKDSEADKAIGGFDWVVSPEGEEFWERVIGNKDFDFFFETYPQIKFDTTKKSISVKDFMKDNKSNLQALERRSKEVFDLTVELLTQLQILEDRKKQAKVEPKAKPTAKVKTKQKVKAKAETKQTGKPKPKDITSEDWNNRSKDSKSIIDGQKYILEMGKNGETQLVPVNVKKSEPKPKKKKTETFELVAISKVVEKDGGDIMNTFYSIEAVDMKVAKSIVTLKWLEEWKTSDFSLVTIMDTTKFQELIKKGEAEGLVQTLDEDVNLDDDDLDFAQGGTTIDLQDLDF